MAHLIRTHCHECEILARCRTCEDEGSLSVIRGSHDHEADRLRSAQSVAMVSIPYYATTHTAEMNISIAKKSPIIVAD